MVASESTGVGGAGRQRTSIGLAYPKKETWQATTDCRGEEGQIGDAFISEKKPRPEQRRRVETPDVETRLRVVNQVLQMASDREAAIRATSPGKYWLECEDKFGLPAAMLKRMASSKERVQLKK